MALKTKPKPLNIIIILLYETKLTIIKNSAIKLLVPGKPMLANIAQKQIQEKIGIYLDKP